LKILSLIHQLKKKFDIKIDNEVKYLTPFKTISDDHVYIKDLDGSIYHIPSNSIFELNNLSWDNLIIIKDDLLEKLIKSKTVNKLDGLMPSFFFRNRSKLRSEIFNKYLNNDMIGLEIGAGSFPHILPEGIKCDYFDKRNENELTTYFSGYSDIKVSTISDLSAVKDKYDFLIAHHVLEHSSNPIKTIHSWHKCLKENALVFLTLPEPSRTYDRERLITTTSHFLKDYVFDEDDYSYDSKLHIAEFILSWRNDPFFGAMNKDLIAEHSFNSMNSNKNDLHWHVWNKNSLVEFIRITSFLDRSGISILYSADVNEVDPNGYLNDIYLVYKINKNDNKVSFKNIEDIVSKKLYNIIKNYS
jgi:hypothetical protein